MSAASNAPMPTPPRRRPSRLPLPACAPKLPASPPSAPPGPHFDPAAQQLGPQPLPPHRDVSYLWGEGPGGGNPDPSRNYDWGCEATKRELARRAAAAKAKGKGKGKLQGKGKTSQDKGKGKGKGKDFDNGKHQQHVDDLTRREKRKLLEFAASLGL